MSPSTITVTVPSRACRTACSTSAASPGHAILVVITGPNVERVAVSLDGRVPAVAAGVEVDGAVDGDLERRRPDPVGDRRRGVRCGEVGDGPGPPEQGGGLRPAPPAAGASSRRRRRGSGCRRRASRRPRSGTRSGATRPASSGRRRSPSGCCPPRRTTTSTPSFTAYGPNMPLQPASAPMPSFSKLSRTRVPGTRSCPSTLVEMYDVLSRSAAVEHRRAAGGAARRAAAAAGEHQGGQHQRAERDRTQTGHVRSIGVRRGQGQDVSRCRAVRSRPSASPSARASHAAP